MTSWQGQSFTPYIFLAKDEYYTPTVQNIESICVDGEQFQPEYVLT